MLSLLNTTLLSFLCSQEWREAGKTALTPTCSFFSLPFSPQTAVVHKEYQKASFLLDVREERRKQQRGVGLL